MTERSHGLFSGRTRHLARHHKPGKLTIGQLLKSFKPGDKVTIVQKGNFKDIPHPRYRGRVGVVVEKRGGSYVVDVKLTKKTTRTLVVPQRHLDKTSPSVAKKATA
ncbi:50S ribosomal protein L21e [uncultured archaeon]|nr:50S ribosomal protein L21e [uncultured archaeon]